MFFLGDTRGREVGGLGVIYNYSYCFIHFKEVGLVLEILRKEGGNPKAVG